MNKAIKSIIFDFDGTLGDTANVIVNTMQATIMELELPIRTDRQCSTMIGLPLTAIPKAMFPECENLTGELYATTYRRLFKNFNKPGEVSLFPNVSDTLHELTSRGLTLTIASSRSHASILHYVEDLGIDRYISLILGADDVENAKPSPEPVNITLRHLSIYPYEAIVVGDTKFDIQMGKNAGCLACGVTYGNGTRDDMLNIGADYIFDDLSEILKVI